MSGKRSLFSDIQKIIHEPNADNRKELALQITNLYKDGGFSSAEEIVFFEIFQLLAKDVDKKVRKALSTSIKDCADLPNDIINNLARDDIDVAEPILMFSTVLTDEDIIDIINISKELSHTLAIAKRENVSEDISNALINTNNDQVVSTLIENKTALINEEGLQKIVRDYNKSQDLMQKLAGRNGLPSNVKKNLAPHVSAELQQTLLKESNISESLANRIISKTANPVISEQSEIEKAEALIKPLYDTGRLNDKIVFEALLKGNTAIFEVSLVYLTKTPIVKIRTAVNNNKSADFSEIYQKAQLNPDLIHSIEIIIDYIYTEVNNNKRQGVFKKGSDLINDLNKRFKRFANEVEIVKNYINK